MVKQSLAGVWSFRETGTQEWLPASVPGGVHTDLLALGLIPDPFKGDHENHVQWVADSDWEYFCQFNVTEEFNQQPVIQLVCDGLDTLATVVLNDHILGHTKNMFRQFRWDIKPYLKEGDLNNLLIKFNSPVKYITCKQAERMLPGVSQAIPGGPHLRKAPCQFGWDWGPQLPPIGIWKDIRLEAYAGPRFSDIHIRQKHKDHKVTLIAQLEMDNNDLSACLATLKLSAPDGKTQSSEISLKSNGQNLIELEIQNPLLWWPNDYGEQPLYQVEVILHKQKRILDQRNYQIGLRTVDLRQESDQWGRSFTFIVNDIPILAKGSNWIPADSFPTRISDSQLDHLISSAAETHQNMLRVWGGGFYEEDRFYDLCDQYGILVWQDFIFSCSIYPLDDQEFIENVQVEIFENIRRLRHRTSLALWCGNNEMEWGWVDWGWKEPQYQVLKTAYDRFFHHTLPAWCAQEDPDHAYWPSSPSSNTPFEDPNGQIQGDAHYWDVWHGRKPFTAYRSQFPRFMSEFGFQALPPLATIRTYADPQDWNMTSYIMERHQKNDSGNSLMVSQMLDIFRLPKDFDALVYLSLVLQAEGIRYGVEHWRRHPERVSGIIYWQLNDCWPVASWSSLDYFGRWKALHYAARRFFAPLLLSIEDKASQQKVFLSNDSLDSWDGTLQWSLETLAGDILSTGQEPAHADPQSATQIIQFDFTEVVNERLSRESLFVCELIQAGQCITRQVAYFAPTKHLNLQDPVLNWQIDRENERLRLQIRSQSLARQVEISIKDLDLIFSDNYFDLPAGRTVQITADWPAGWTLENLQAAILVRSIYDSFAHPIKQ